MLGGTRSEADYAVHGKKILTEYYYLFLKKIGAFLAVSVAFSLSVEVVLFYRVVIKSKEKISLRFYVFTLWLVFSALANLVWTSISDPGYLPVIITKHTDKKFVEFIKGSSWLKRVLLKLINSTGIKPLKNKYGRFSIKEDQQELIDFENPIHTDAVSTAYFEPESYSSSIKKGIKKLVRSLEKIPRPKYKYPERNLLFSLSKVSELHYYTHGNLNNSATSLPMRTPGGDTDTLSTLISLPRPHKLLLYNQGWSYSPSNSYSKLHLPLNPSYHTIESKDSNSVKSVHSLPGSAYRDRSSICTIPDKPGSPRTDGRNVVKVLEKDSMYKIIYMKNQTSLLKFCKICSIWKSVSCKHCSICRRCVDYHEKHSILFSNCLGRRNFRYYYSSLAFLTITSLWMLANTVIYVRNIVRKHSTVDRSNLPSFLIDNFQVTFLIILLLVKSIFGLLFLSSNTLSAFRGLTYANKMLEVNLYKYLFSASGDLERKYILECIGRDNSFSEGAPPDKMAPSVLPITLHLRTFPFVYLNKINYHALNFLCRLASYKPRR